MSSENVAQTATTPLTPNDQPGTRPPALPPPNGTSSDEVAEETGVGIVRIIVGAAIGFIAVIVLVFVIAVILAITSLDRAAPLMSLFRDYVLIVLALQGILTGFAFVVFVVQLARLVNLLTNETGPLLDTAKETVETARKTTAFVSRNLREPITKGAGFFAGSMVFLKEVGGIRRAIRRTMNGNEEQKPDA